MAERDPEPEIATTTLAEIYVQQGLFDRALAIYRRVAERSPGDERLMRRVAEIEGEMERARAGGDLAAIVASGADDGSGSGGDEPTPAAAAPRAVPSAGQDPQFLAWLERR